MARGHNEDPKQESISSNSGERLQKVLANRGVSSRRGAEQLIVDGRVQVNGTVITELGTRVNPYSARIEVDGKRVAEPRLRYIMLNKPSGYITTMDDERGRATVSDLIDVPQRVVPVGRLDRPTEGLLVFTNDGELAYRIMHPSYEIEKEYLVQLDGFPPQRILDMVRKGITIDRVRTIPTQVVPLRQTEDGTIVRVGMHEGRNRIIRRIFKSVDFPVLKLMRTRIGPLQLGTIPRGGFRDMTAGELDQIRQAVGLDTEDAFQAPSRRETRRGANERRRNTRA